MRFGCFKLVFLLGFWLCAGLSYSSDKGYAVAGSFKSLTNAQSMAVSIDSWLKSSGIPGQVEIEESVGKTTSWNRVVIIPGDGVSARSVISLLKQGGYTGAWFLPSSRLEAKQRQPVRPSFVQQKTEVRDDPSSAAAISQAAGPEQPVEQVSTSVDLPVALGQGTKTLIDRQDGIPRHQITVRNLP